MEIFLQISDVFRFAIRIEEDSEAFYRKSAIIAKDDGAKTLFNYLADEEMQHKKIFQDMLSKKDELMPAETFQGEYLAYLRDHIDNKVIFTKDAKDRQVSDVHDTLSAINFAMQLELDSILYYQEIKQFIRQKERAEIDKIIAEERKHFTKLAETKSNYQ